MSTMPVTDAPAPRPIDATLDPAPDAMLPFAQSQRSTVGIEWELALVDDDSGDMRQVAPAIMAALDRGGEHPHIQQEFMQNTVELVSGVSHTVAEAGRDLAQSGAQVRAITDPMRVGLISAGTHPFAPWQAQKITEAKRYLTVLDRAAMLGQQVAIFGVHTHVGVEARAKVLPIMRTLLVYQPHLQALSASSPYWDSRDTGYASMRALIFQQLPTAGLPYQFETWREFSGYVTDLLRTGVISSYDEIRWDVRPALKYGTIEVRVCDGASNLQELLALAALTHCLIEWISTNIDDGAPLQTLRPWFVAENKWRAARYGLDAEIIIDDDGAQAPLRQLIPDLITSLEPTAARLGCERELAAARQILVTGASYERQRRVYQLAKDRGAGDHEALEAVVAHLVAEMRADRPLPASYAAMWA